MMALSGENFGPCDDTEKSASGLRPSRCPPSCAALRVDLTIVCIDTLEKTLIESRKTNGQPPLSSDIVAYGLDGSSNKTDRTRKRANCPPPQAFVNAIQRHGK